MTAVPMLVVAAALIDERGRVLVAQRSPNRAHGGLWEFPGGKVEPGETLACAVARELREELGIGVDQTSAIPVGFTTCASGERELVLLLFAIDRWDGDPADLDHQALAWQPPSALVDLPMPPGDRALLAALERYMASCVMEARAGIEPACKDLQSSA